MSIEPVGFVTIAVGLVCLLLGYRIAVATLVVATVFGSAAAILVGAANIQPAHLLLAFVAAATLAWRRNAANMVKAISPLEPGFWLACMVVYGIIAGYFFPRLLAGSTQIIPLGASEYAYTGSTVPLGPVSSNFTQAIYLSADLFCFAMIVAVASARAGFEAITNALIAYAVANVLFALLDLGTSATGTEYLMQFMRNAEYSLHTDDQVGGIKRIVGSWPEASAFAGTTVGVLGFTGTMWLCGHRPVWTGILALASLVLIVLSTSSAGIVGAPIALLILYGTALMRCGFGPSTRNSLVAVLAAPPLILLAVLAILLSPATSAMVANYVDLLIISKTGTQSAIERASWNTSGLQNFFDSWGFGVGLGTARTSSFPIALLSNVGVPGTVFYGLFALSVFVVRRGRAGTYPSDIRLAARNGCLSLLVVSLIVGPTVDQGLLFCILAALACAEPEEGVAHLRGRQPTSLKFSA